MPHYTRLSAAATVGATTIAVEDAVNWHVGDTVVISGTPRAPSYTSATRRQDQTEERTVQRVSGNIITLNAPLAFAHMGGPPQSLNGTYYRVGAEVAVLTRQIMLTGGHTTRPVLGQGWGLNVGCTAAVTPGCTSGESGMAMSATKTALLQVDGVQLVDIGQERVRHAGVELDGLISPRNTVNAEGSFIANSAVQRSWNNAISVRHTTAAFVLYRNVIYRPQGEGIRVMGPDNILSENLVVSSRIPAPQCTDVYEERQSTTDCRSGSYRLAKSNAVVRNVASSGVGAGFITDGDECGAATLWEGNVVRTHRDGVLVMDMPADRDYQWPRTVYQCRWVRGVTAHGCNDHGFVAWYVTGNLLVEHMTLVDNQIGFAAVLFTENVDRGAFEPTATLRHSTLTGQWPGQSCRAELVYPCRRTLVDSYHWCTTFHNSTPRMGNVGLMETLFLHAQYAGRTKGEHKSMWIEPDSYATLRGKMHVSNVHFSHFSGDACHEKSVAIYQNPFSNDTFHQHVFSGISWHNTTLAGRFYARRMYGVIPGHTTNGQPSVWLDFDNDVYGAYWPDAPNKVWLTDADGTLTSVRRGHIVASETITRETQFASLRWDGRGLRNVSALPSARQGCTKVDAWNAFLCDHRRPFVSLVIEHLGDDQLARRAAPVVLCHGDGMTLANGDPACQRGVVDYASGPVMKGKTQRATLERLTRWRFIAEHGVNYTLFFRGEPPAWMRMRLTNDEYLGLGSTAGVTLNIRYFGVNAQQRVGVYVLAQRQQSQVYDAYPWELSPPLTWPAPTDAAGTHFHNKKLLGGGSNAAAVNVLSVTLRSGDANVTTLRQEPIVVVTMTVAVTEEQLRRVQEAFVLGLANALGISASRLRVVLGTTSSSSLRRLLQAGTPITVEIEDDPSNLPPVTDDTASTTAAPPTTTAAPTPTLASIAMQVTNLESSSVSNVTVLSVAARVQPVVVSIPPVRVADGVGYVEVNVTVGQGAPFSASPVAVQASSYLRNRSHAAPQNVTDEGDLLVGNVHTFTSGTTRYTMFVAYDGDEYTVAQGNAAATVLGTGFVNNNAAMILPDGYQLVGYRLVGITVSPPATPPPPPSPSPPPGATSTPNATSAASASASGTPRTVGVALGVSCTVLVIGIAGAVAGVHYRRRQRRTSFVEPKSDEPLHYPTQSPLPPGENATDDGPTPYEMAFSPPYDETASPAPPDWHAADVLVEMEHCSEDGPTAAQETSEPFVTEHRSEHVPASTPR